MLFMGNSSTLLSQTLNSLIYGLNMAFLLLNETLTL